MDTLKRLPLALLLLRLGVFIVMLMWTLDKLVKPEHAAKVFKRFYFIDGLPSGAFYEEEKRAAVVTPGVTSAPSQSA